MDTDPTIDLALLRNTLPKVAAPWVLQLQLELVEACMGQVVMRMPVSAPLVHGGGVLCGQALMAAADTAMILAITTHLGEFKPMTTVQLQTSFMRAVSGQSAHVGVTARVLRMGRKLVFGEIHLHGDDGTLAAHATTTYALL
jgi:uncharacterized protein (TIGR00369 family)